MDKTIMPVPLKGEIYMPPSKSMAHRAILAAGLSKGRSIINNIALSDDISATMGAIKLMGADTAFKDGALIIDGIKSLNKSPVIDCGESGTTLRLLIPVLAALGQGTLTGRGRLPGRPIDEYLKIFDMQALDYKRDKKGLPIEIKGRLISGKFELSGKASSQYVSGLMFALPLLKGTSEIIITDALESSGYADMTVHALKAFGIEIFEAEKYRHYTIEGAQSYSPCGFVVEGDWSQAAFFLLAGTLGGSLKIRGLNMDTCQKDKGFIELLKEMGADIKIKDDAVIVNKSRLKAITADVSQTPDIAPALAGAMAAADGTSVITGGRRLRLKESDRITDTANALNAIGAKISPAGDGMEITGVERLAGGITSSFNDHRIAMTVCALAPVCNNSIILKEAQAVNKSYPSFYDEMSKLGGKII